MTKIMENHRKQRGKGRYESTLRKLQIELVKIQKHVIKHGHKVLVIYEGRAASGKDGTIKRIVGHLVELSAQPKPTDEIAICLL